MSGMSWFGIAAGEKGNYSHKLEKKSMSEAWINSCDALISNAKYCKVL